LYNESQYIRQNMRAGHISIVLRKFLWILDLLLDIAYLIINTQCVIVTSLRKRNGITNAGSQKFA